jgi:hypothetical protein
MLVNDEKLVKKLNRRPEWERALGRSGHRSEGRS